MNIKVGSAPDSWGVWFPSDPKQIPWQRCLDEIAEAGYEWTELGPYGYLPTDLSVLRSELERRKLKICGTFMMPHLEDGDAWPEIEKEAMNVGNSLTALGAEFVILIDNTYSDVDGKPVRPSRLDDDGWKTSIENTHKIADLVIERFGLNLVYHPHSETHVEYEDQIELLLEQTDPSRVSMALDTGHHAYRGGDPIAFMRRHHDRIRYLHLKSVDPEIQKKVEREKIAFAPAVAMGVFCELDQGAVDFLAFRDVLREVNYEGWAVVEQDLYPADFDTLLPIGRRNREYLREIGVG